MKAILLAEIEGKKCDGGAISAVKRFFSERFATYSTTRVVCGELLESCQNDDQPFNYRLCRDPGVLLFCEADNVATLDEEQFHLLEALSRPADRLEVFRHKLEWGMSLKDGAGVHVTLPSDSASPPTYAKAIVRYRGKIGNQCGTFFGVELMVCSA